MITFITKQGPELFRGFLADPWGCTFEFYRGSLFRWLVAGLAFLLINSVFMVVLVEGLKLKTLWATLISAEMCTILRFFVNQHWVFKEVGPIWKRLFQFHVANAGSFVIWMIAANLLIHWGLHYLLASALAVGVSTIVSMASNFLWVWRKLDPEVSASLPPQELQTHRAAPSM